MAPRPTWKGYLRVSLVTIPVKVFPATESAAALSFNQLHGECQTKIQQKKWCPKCEREITSAEVVKGYEFEKGRWVVLSDEDIADLRGRADENVQQAVRETHGVLDLGEEQRGERGLRGRLEHDGAPCRQCGSDLVCHEVQREVERADGAHHADGDPQGEAQLARARGGRLEGDHLAHQAPPRVFVARRGQPGERGDPDVGTRIVRQPAELGLQRRR